MIYRSSLSFVFHHWFFAKLQALNLVQFSDQTGFPDFFSKCLQIFTSFWHGSQSLCFTDQLRVSLSSIDFWRNYWPWNLVDFSDQTVFRTFFLNACKYWPDFWHVSQSQCFTDRVWVLLCSIDFWQKYWPWNLVNFSNQTVFRTFFLNPCRYWPDFGHVSQSPWLTDRVWVSLCSIDFWEITDLGLSKFQGSNSFLQFFPKRFQIVSLFLACKSIIITFTSSWSFIAPWFFVEILALDLVNFIYGIVIQTFFLYPCRYCADFWHVSQSPAFLKAMHTKTDTFLIL